MSSLIRLIKSISPNELRVAPKTARAHFPDDGSPYKPLMLLAVATKILDRHPGFLTARFKFDDVWPLFVRLHGELCPNVHRPVGPNIAAQPFWKLGAGTPLVWRLVPMPGQADALTNTMRKPSGSQVKSHAKLNRLVHCAEFPDADWWTIRDPICCEAIISYLLASYFKDVDSARGLRTRLRRALEA